MARERIHRDNAEKQRAYRDRLASEETEAYRKMRGLFWESLERFIAEGNISDEEARLYRRLYVKHLPVK